MRGKPHMKAAKAEGAIAWADLVREVLGARSLVIVDGGARNKTWELPRLAPLCDVIGFEPNREEHAKILAGTTDLEVARKVPDLPYRSIRYVDKALSDRPGRAMLRITRGAGASSLFEPNVELIAAIEHHFSFGKDLAEQFRVVGTEEVETTTLDAVAEQEGLDRIDYLKLDVQGMEYECLLGAEGLLKARRVGVIKTEVEFLPLYKGQHLFADIDAFLRSHGFMLLDLDFDSRHKVIWSGHRIRADRGTLLFGEAYYTLSMPVHRELEETDRVRHALVLSELGFLDLAIALIEGIGPETGNRRLYRRVIDGMLQDRRTWKRRVKDWGKGVFGRMGRLLGD